MVVRFRHLAPMFPHYSYPFRTLTSLAAAVLSGSRRSFRADGLVCIRSIRPPLQVYGSENILRAGPCIITFNHYSRPGFSAW